MALVDVDDVRDTHIGQPRKCSVVIHATSQCRPGRLAFVVTPNTDNGDVDSIVRIRTIESARRHDSTKTGRTCRGKELASFHISPLSLGEMAPVWFLDFG